MEAIVENYLTYKKNLTIFRDSDTIKFKSFDNKYLPNAQSTKSQVHQEMRTFYSDLPFFSVYLLLFESWYNFPKYLTLSEKFCPQNQVLNLLALSVFKIQIYFLICSRMLYKKADGLNSKTDQVCCLLVLLGEKFLELHFMPLKSK